MGSADELKLNPGFQVFERSVDFDYKRYGYEQSRCTIRLKVYTLFMKALSMKILLILLVGMQVQMDGRI